MGNLNLTTVELVSTLRQAPSNGPTNSQDYNDSQTEVLADLASLSGFINDILIPILDGLSLSIQPISVTAPHGLEGRYIFSDTNDLTSVFFDNLSNQPLTIAESLKLIQGFIQAVQVTVANLNVEVTALQTQLSSTNQNDIAQALQNFAADLSSLTVQVIANTEAISNATPPPPVSIAIYAGGIGTNGEILSRFRLSYAITFPAGAPASKATAAIAATGTGGGAATYTFKKNGTAFATVVFDSSISGGLEGVYTQASDAVFAANDLFELDGPATADTTLADVGFTLQGNRT